jgi:putative membrane protein
MMGFGGGGLLHMILLWAGLIALAVWLVRSLLRSVNRSADARESSSLSAREILARRYARGEINHEEYQSMKEVISG